MDGFVQFAHVIWMDRIYKSLGLFHVDLFIEHTMQEGVENIQLLKCPVEVSCKSQNQAYGSRFDNWTKGVMIVNTTQLIKPLGDEASLEPFYTDFCFILNTHLLQTTLWCMGLEHRDHVLLDNKT